MRPLLLIALGLSLCPTFSLGAAAPEPPRLQGAVLIVLDTLRADRLVPYGYAQPTSPRLVALAQRGVVFEQAVTHSPWTLPALVGLFSGEPPTREVYVGVLRRSLVETLASGGYRTAAFTEGGYASRIYGFDRGFASYHQTDAKVPLFLDGRRIASNERGHVKITFGAARAWLDTVGEEPFFLLVHTYEAHAPYRRQHFSRGEPHGELGPTFEIEDMRRVRQGELTLSPPALEHLGRLYDGGVWVADAQVGVLLDTLDARGLRDRTLVVVTSDHGEDLGERVARFAGDHGHTLFDEQLRVPLLWVDPSRTDGPRRISSQVRLLDVMPTVVDRLGFDVPGAGDPLSGRSLLPLLDGSEAGHRPAFARQFDRGRNAEGPARLSLRDGRHKLVVSHPRARPPGPPVALFDLETDPQERHDVAAERPELRDALRRQLDAALQRLEERGAPDFSAAGTVSPELEERLRELGYVQ